MYNIGNKLQTKYGTCVILSETQMEVIDSNDEAYPNGTKLDTPALEIKQISQEKHPPVAKTPKTPKPAKSVEQEIAEAEAELKVRKAKLASLLG